MAYAGRLLRENDKSNFGRRGPFIFSSRGGGEEGGGVFLGGVHRKKKCDKEEGHQKKRGLGEGIKKQKKGG